METASVSGIPRVELAPELPSRIIVVERSTGEIVDALGNVSELDEPLARAISIAVAALSSLEESFGGELRLVEVEYSAGRTIVLVDGNLVRIGVEV